MITREQFERYLSWLRMLRDDLEDDDVCAYQRVWRVTELWQESFEPVFGEVGTVSVAVLREVLAALECAYIRAEKSGNAYAADTLRARFARLLAEAEAEASLES